MEKGHMTFVSYNVLFFLERLNAPPRHSVPSDQANRRYHNHGSWVPVALLVTPREKMEQSEAGSLPSSKTVSHLNVDSVMKIQ